jgi:hypothetical protein
MEQCFSGPDRGNLSKLTTALGGFFHKEWLKPDYSLIINTYFHNLIIMNEFYAPRLCDADFRMVDTFVST